MKHLIGHLKKYILRGLIALIPVTLTYFVVRFLYVTIDKRITGLVDDFLGFAIPGLGIALLLFVFYLCGLAASNVIGRQLLHLVERISVRIPLVKSTYQIGKQLSATLSMPERQAFKKAVLVDYLKPGIWTIGFVTGSVIDKKHDNEKLLKVFVPTPPNPASGTMVVVKESETRDPGWSIEEAMRAVLSGGIIGPSELR
jgi:uncharacterized membrane protein